jgi:hypothetical protein
MAMSDGDQSWGQTYLKMLLYPLFRLTHSIDVLRPMSLTMEDAQKVGRCAFPPLSLPANPHASRVESRPLRV